jgi:hypothetical protein
LLKLVDHSLLQVSLHYNFISMFLLANLVNFALAAELRIIL